MRLYESESADRSEYGVRTSATRRLHARILLLMMIPALPIVLSVVVGVWSLRGHPRVPAAVSDAGMQRLRLARFTGMVASQAEIQSSRGGPVPSPELAALTDDIVDGFASFDRDSRASLLNPSASARLAAAREAWDRLRAESEALLSGGPPPVHALDRLHAEGARSVDAADQFVQSIVRADAARVERVMLVTKWCAAATAGLVFLAYSLARLWLIRPLQRAAVHSDEHTRKLSQHRHRLRLALEAAGAGTWTWYPATNAVQWDEAMAALYGVPYEDFEGRYEQWAQIVHPDDLHGTESLLRESLASHQPFETTFRIRRSDGDHAVIYARGIVDRDTTTGETIVIGVNLDITERQENFEERRLLSLVAEHTENAVVITDRESYIEWVNDGFVRLTGYSLDEVKGRKPGDFLQGPDTDPATVAVMREGVRSGKGFDVRIVNYAKDGTAYWLAIEVRPIPDDSGETCGFIAVERDISHEVRLETRLKDERALLDSVVSSIPFSVYWRNPAGRVIGWNRQLMEVASERGAVREGPIDDMDAAVRNLFGEGIEEEDRAVFAGTHLVSGEDRYVEHPERGVRTFRVVKQPVKDTYGYTHGMLAVYMDVSEQRMLETQLSQAQKLESIGSLAAGIAHEINTPTQYVADNTRFLEREFKAILRVIDTYSSQLRQDGPARTWAERIAELESVLKESDFEFLREEIPQAIAQSLDGINRISDIVRAMKEFSHPGRSEFEAVDLNHALQATATVCKNRWKYVATVEYDLDADLPRVPCLVGEINQAFLNLIVNAADAIEQHKPAEPGRIVLRTRRTQTHAIVEIEDNGGGIPREIRDRLFEPFFTTKEVGRGTGQGLPISRSVVVKKHAGELSFSVREGVGTTFRVELPLQQEPRERSQEEPQERSAA